MGKRIKHIACCMWKNNFAVFFIFFILVIGFLDNNSWINKRAVKNENERLRAEISEYEIQCHRDSLKLQQLKSSPNAVIRVAREVHLMKADDEDVYLVSIESEDKNEDIE